MSDSNERVLNHQPVFPDVAPQAKWERFLVQGLVELPLELTHEALMTLAQQEFAEDFHCVEGWVVPDQKWGGVLVSTLLALAKPLPGAKYLGFSAGSYTVSLSLEEVEHCDVIIALRLNGKTLTNEHGGPCRLIATGKECHFSVKWVDRIELRATPAEDTGRLIAKVRAGGN
jgi:DMSO/TMAO reductase YedYZ molybdopterin-dependent catalytic subunit